MKYPQGMIFLGDLIKAIKQLKIEESSAIEVVASALGFELEVVSDIQINFESQPSNKAGILSPESDFTPASNKQARSKSSLPEIKPSDPIPDPIVPSPESVSFELEEYLVDIHKTENMKDGWPEWDEPKEIPQKMKLLSLIREDWARGIMSEILSVNTLGPIDLEMAIDILAKAKPLENIPRKRIKKLNGRYQILVDVSENMKMFFRDIWDLVGTIKSVAGSDELDVFLFRGIPPHGLEKENSYEIIPYQLPLPGTLIVIVSNFCIPNSLNTIIEATQGQWVSYLSFLKESGYDVRAFVPFPPARWPLELKKQLVLVHWNRSTTANTVRRAIDMVA